MSNLSPDSYSANLPPADQEKARMLALDLLDPNKYVNEQQICYVARAFLELSTSSNGPSDKGWIALEDRLPTANDASAEGTVLAWFPGAKEARTRHWKIVQAWQVSEDDDSMRGAFWMPLPNIPDATSSLFSKEHAAELDAIEERDK